MIKIEDNNVTMLGSVEDLVAETAAILAGTYRMLIGQYGEEQARMCFAAIGRTAASENAFEGMKNWVEATLPADEQEKEK